MAGHRVSLRDMARHPAEVARGLPAWARGEPGEAAAQTLAASSRELHGRSYTLWVWAGSTGTGEPAWALPVPASAAAAFAPKGPARALVRSLDAATLAGADPGELRLQDWRGLTCLVAPGLDPDLADDALAEAHPPPCRTAVATLPAEVALGGTPIALRPLGAGGGDGLGALARHLGVHPVRVALALLAHGQPAEQDSYHPGLATALREWGCVGNGPAEPRPAPSLAIEDDPCPLRRHARTVLQRMLRMGKVGPEHHTEFAHFARGAAAHHRRQALEVGEALIRAGLLGQKPSVGQRHVYLNVRRLRDIHALIDRGETSDPELAAVWTAPGPTEDVVPGVSGAPPARSR